MYTLPFTKMHGLGNDFVVLDCLGYTPALPYPALARQMCNRRFGVGADGLIVLAPADDADLRMRIFNADGTEAQMCGNGLRCVGLYAVTHLGFEGDTLRVATMPGIKTVGIERMGGKVTSLSVNMGAPSYNSANLPAAAPDGSQRHQMSTKEGTFTVNAVSLGNPHGVIFVDSDPATLDIATIGPQLECNPLWPERANIEFIRVCGPRTLLQRTWERGVGETEACGTGACVAAATALNAGVVKAPVEVCLKGGSLYIARDEDGNIIMSGPATEVFTGTFYVNL